MAPAAVEWFAAMLNGARSRGTALRTTARYSIDGGSALDLGAARAWDGFGSVQGSAVDHVPETAAPAVRWPCSCLVDWRVDVNATVSARMDNIISAPHCGRLDMHRVCVNGTARQVELIKEMKIQGKKKRA